MGGSFKRLISDAGGLCSETEMDEPKTDSSPMAPTAVATEHTNPVATSPAAADLMAIYGVSITPSTTPVKRAAANEAVIDLDKSANEAVIELKECPPLQSKSAVQMVVDQGEEEEERRCYCCPRVGHMAFVTCLVDGTVYGPVMGPNWYCNLVVWAIVLTLLTLWIVVLVPQFDNTAFEYVSYGIGALAVLALFGTSCRDPGIQLKSGSAQQRLCQKCDIRMARTTTHCGECGVCVKGHDHHCPVMGLCIGRGNIACFWTFIVIACTFPLLFIGTIIAVVVHVHG